MSIQVANIDLSAAVVGTVGSIPLGQSMPPPTIAQQMQPQSVIVAQLVVFNESGCGLVFTFPVTRETLTCPAGGWRQIAVPPNEISLQYQVTYVLPNAPVAQLLVDLYLPGEAPDSIGTLGNSPIGVSGQVATSVNQVINNGNPAPTLVVQGTPSGSANAELQWNNDGSGTFGGGNVDVSATGVFTSIPIGAIPGTGISGTVPAATAAAQLTADATHRAVAVWDSTNSRLDIGPDTNVHPQAIALLYEDASGTRRVAFIGNADNSGSVGGPFGASLAWDASGNLSTIGGVSTVGFGAPVMLARALNVHVTSTASTTILQIASLAATGLFRISGHIALGAGGGSPLFRTSYTEPNVGTGIAFGISQGPSGGKLLDGTEPAIGGLTPVPMTPIVVYAQTGTTLTVLYQNTTGTPSDFISVLVERLA